MAFTNASVALVHGMSRPIGAHFHVPHGLSNAMLLPAITRFSLNAALPRYAQAARLAGFAHETDADQLAGAKLLSGLEDLNKELGVPTPGQFGIAQTDWHSKTPLMATQALASGSPANNPRIPDHAEIMALYETVYG
jgi:alcohol dehydrogenase class IV